MRLQDQSQGNTKQAYKNTRTGMLSKALLYYSEKENNSDAAQ